MIKQSAAFENQREEKIAQIKLLYDKAHEYKVKHADAWKSEEDAKKRETRLKNLVELFRICELLKNVVIDQINAVPTEEIKEEDHVPIIQIDGSPLDAFREGIVMRTQPAGKKKKKKQKKEKNEDF